MPSSKKKLLIKTVLTAAKRSCSRSKSSHVHEPRAVPRSAQPTISQKDPQACDRSGANQESSTSTVSHEDHPKGSKIIDSIPVVKNSNDTYQDFRHSMLQMIFEKEIYSKDDLQELLNCFLELNSPYYHGQIIQAFTEIWNEVICKKLKSQN